MAKNTKPQRVTATPPRISNTEHAEIERLCNCAIHEIVFAVQHSDQDDVDDACQCLMTAQGNLERVAEMLSAKEN